MKSLSLILYKTIQTVLVFTSLIFVGACNVNNQTVVRAEGRDFYWHFTYPGPDNIFDTLDDIKSAKLLHIPSHQKTVIEVTSLDYIYMFRSEELNIKEVAVPGLTFRIEFTPKKIGEFELIVDPMCGYNFMHNNDYMGFIHLTTNHEFQHWISSNG